MPNPWDPEIPADVTSLANCPLGSWGKINKLTLVAGCQIKNTKKNIAGSGMTQRDFNLI